MKAVRIGAELLQVASIKCLSRSVSHRGESPVQYCRILVWHTHIPCSGPFKDFQSCDTIFLLISNAQPISYTFPAWEA